MNSKVAAATAVLLLQYAWIPSTAAAGLVATVADRDGNVVDVFGAGGRAVDDVCTEAEDLPGPRCNDSIGKCYDSAGLGVCMRPGYLVRFTLCVQDEFSVAHEGHPFDWATTGSLPSDLELVTPSSPSTAPEPTSTAYIGGDYTITASPPDHNGKHFGPVLAPFCGEFGASNDDLCEGHDFCNIGYRAVVHVLDTDPMQPEPGFVTTSLPGATIDEPYDAKVEAAGGAGQFLYSLYAGTLPNGVLLGEDGSLAGTPTELGDFQITIAAAEDPAAPAFQKGPACEEAPDCGQAVVGRIYHLVVSEAPPTTTTTTTTTTTSSSSTSTSTSTSTTTTTTPPPPPVCGDANGNGLVTAADALAILKAAVGGKECDAQPCVCDMGGNGSITAADALLALKIAVGQPLSGSCDC